jgi:hypothetical protein
MENAFHPFSQRFAQLGSPNDPQGIAPFIIRHLALAGDAGLPDAAFLREALVQDSNRVGPAGALSEALRGQESTPSP